MKGSAQMFASETTIHGLREVFAPKYSRANNFIWFLLFLAATGHLCWFLHYTISAYLDEPKASVVSLQSIDSFPYLSYCPGSWINDSVARKIGFTREMYAYIDSMFLLSPNKQFWMVNGKKFKAPNNSDVDWTLVKKDLVTILNKRNQSLNSLLSDLSYTPWEIMEYVPTDNRDKSMDGWKNETAIGICYGFKDRRKFSPFAMETAILKVIVHERKSEITFREPVMGEWANYLFVGPVAAGFYPTGEYAVSAGGKYRVKIKPTKITRLTSTENACFEGAQLQGRDSCLTRCLDAMCQGSQSCKIYHKASLTGDLDQFCTYMDAENHCFLEKEMEFDQCFSFCPVSCTEILFTASFIPGKYAPNEGTSQYIITMENPSTVLMVKEYHTFSFTSMFSNIGGITSLFLGCSVMSILHAIFFWVIRCHKLFCRSQNTHVRETSPKKEISLTPR